MRTFRFSEILARLETVDEWLEGLGLNPKPCDRIHRAIEALQKADEGWRRFRETRQPTKIGSAEAGEYYFAITEAFEFSEILEAFQHEPAQVLGPKLRRALKGPFLPFHETNENSEGRNTMFELALGAEFRLLGTSVSIGDPDLIFTFNDIPFCLECKRPSAEHAIRSNALGAAGQLKAKLDQPEQKAAFGIIAISASRILNPGTKIFATPTERGKEGLGNKLEALMRENERHWARRDDLHPRISAVLFHVATPAAVGDPEKGADRLVRMTYTTVMPVGRKGPAFHILEEVLPDLFKQDQIRFTGP